MKKIKSQTLLACVLLVSIASGAMAASSAVRRGTSILHYQTRNVLETTDAGSNITGSVSLQLNEQGHSSMQKFNLNVGGLVPDADYFLLAAVGEDTNVVYVSTVKANSHGRLALSHMKLGQGKGKHSVPDALNPLTDIRGIELQDASQTQTVAFAWINTSSNFNYMVKRNLTGEDTNSAARGSISLIANQDHVNFRLAADGLGASNTCYLALNSTIVDTATTDSHGRILIKNWPSGSPAILDLRSLAVLDAVSNVVLTTTLPK